MVAIHPRSSVALPALVAFLGISLLVGCGQNNIGRLFDRDPGGGPGGTTGVVTIPAGGDALDSRPRVTEAFPQGGGWPTAVPVVVVFNESLNTDLLVPATGDPLVFLRVAGTDVPLPATYDFLFGAKVVLIRPAAPLSGEAGVSYEVVVDPEARDVDGTRFGGTEPEVVAVFTADEDPSEEDGRILTLLPQDNEADVHRETEIFAVFTKPANTASVTSTNFKVEIAAGAAVAGNLAFPLPLLGMGLDARVLRFTPDSPLDGATTFEVTVDDTITFGTDGKLSFLNRTPFADFQTLAFEAVESVGIDLLGMGMFPDQINRGNMATLIVDVTVPSSATLNDTVLVRVYGLDPKTTPTDDVNFVERSQVLTMTGSHLVTLDFTSALGTLVAPRFSDGDVTIAAQLQRGSQHSGFVHADSDNDPRLDVTCPDLSEVGPPMSGTGDIITDLEHLVFYGTATEQIHDAMLTVDSTNYSLYASSADGRFVMEPVLLGRRTGPLAYVLTLTDLAGNMKITPLSGAILQRGVVTGVQTGTLTVEAYDEATLQALTGVTVVLDPDVPTVPPTGQMTGITGADGRVAFSVMAGARYTVTLVHAGYHLRTLYDTGAAHVSLPLRPTSGDTASLTGTALFASLSGESVLVGCNAIDNVLDEEIATTTTAPTTIPSTAIRPNRPLVITALGGAFEPTMTPTFRVNACQICGVDGLTATPPGAPAAPGEVANLAVALLPAVPPAPAPSSLASLMSTYPKDFSASTGLGNIVGTPTVRVMTALNGFSGQILMGVGFAMLVSGKNYTVDASYSLLPLVTPAPYVPGVAVSPFISTEATDTAGNVARHRALLVAAFGTVVDTLSTPGIPTITGVISPSAAAPRVTYMDRLDRTAGTSGIGFGLTEITATDTGGAGRGWSLMIEDQGTVGSVDVQFPDLSGIGVPGLASGTWSIRVEEFLYLSTSFALGDFLHEERFRQQAAYARAVAMMFTVN